MSGFPFDPKKKKNKRYNEFDGRFLEGRKENYKGIKR